MLRHPERRASRAVALFAAFTLAGASSAGAQADRAGSAPAPRFADVRLPTGIRMHYAEAGRERGGTPVILLHGYTDSWFSWSLVMPQLAGTHHVFALDQRGHGRTSRPRDGYSLASLAADVIAFMDAKGIARATVVGHSLGGMVAQRVAKFAPQRVSGLVLVATTSTTRHDALREFVQAVRELPDEVPLAFAADFQKSTVHAPVPPEFLQAMIAGSQGMPGRVWKSIAEGFIEEPAIEPLARVPFPVLVMSGERDEIFPRTEIAELQRIFPGARHVDFAATGHSPHWERPGRFVRQMQDFLSMAVTATR
jgi:non-heme chloroperoxidase